MAAFRTEGRQRRLRRCRVNGVDGEPAVAMRHTLLTRSRAPVREDGTPCHFVQTAQRCLMK